MTQESSNRPSPSKRTARAAKNRPTLIKSTADIEASLTDAQSVDEQEVSSPSEEAEATPAVEPIAKAPRARRLPSFFSTVGKSEKRQEADVAQARLARATRGKVPAAADEVSKQSEAPQRSESKEPTRARAATTSAAPARPASLFKMRYIWGMVLYLVLADVLGIFERSFLVNSHLEGKLTEFTLFGGKITIYVSTIVFLLTLVAILIILARFDLIPRNLGALSSQTQTQNRKSQNTSAGSKGGGSTASSKPALPTMRQGVRGADDDLYQEYRARQRREKKR